MFYTGGRNGIGLATSPDGVTWARHDDPATTRAPEAESDPVFTRGASGERDGLGVHQPRVALTPDGYVMLYHANSGATSYGIAASPDGLTWTRRPDNPT